MSKQNANVLTVSRHGITLAIAKVELQSWEPHTAEGWAIIAEDGIYHVYPTEHPPELTNQVTVDIVLKTVKKLIDSPVYSMSPLHSVRMLIKQTNEVIIATSSAQYLVSWGKVVPLLAGSTSANTAFQPVPPPQHCGLGAYCVQTTRHAPHRFLLRK